MKDTPPGISIKSSDQGTVQAAAEVLAGKSTKGRLARLLPFLGPAFIASVAYVDPGNFATNIQGGAKFGYMLLWVILASNLIAMLLQALSAKLGIATGMNLAEHCRTHFPRPVVWGMWVLMEIVAMATDLAEFLGAALGFNLLFGIPMWIAGILTAIATFLILGLERRGFRPLEAVITALVGTVAVSYVIETILDRPDLGQVLYHAVVPQFAGTESILLATGILGATVMPHAIFLHSALMQDRIVVRDPVQLRRLFRLEIVDVLVAMGLASLINAAMLIMAASTFFNRGLSAVGSIQEAHQTMEPLLGSASSAVFAISLLAAGLSSASVGTMAGQVMMQGFVHRHIPPWLRRLVTMGPSLLVIIIGLDPTRTLVISQVVLSFGLPFAVIPLVMFTRRRDLMGVLVNRRRTTILASLIAGLIIGLNFYLLYQILSEDKAMFKQLLVPLDGSRLAEATLPATLYLAQSLKASVKLVHIIEKNAPKEIHGEHHLTNEEDARAYLDAVAKRAFPPAISVACHVHTTETSNITRSIVEHVGELASDLIVMCTHGHGDVRSWVFGSIAQQVIALGPCPVLLIRPKDAETPSTFSCQNILIPLDGNPDHEQVIPIAAELASVLSADVHLVTAVHTRGTLSGERAALSTLLPNTTSALLDLAQQSAGDYVQGPVTRLQNAGVAVTTRVQRGEPAQVIARTAEEIRADLIVLGTHGKAGMDAFWEGSITPKIARQTPVPMLLVRVHEARQD